MKQKNKYILIFIIFMFSLNLFSTELLPSTVKKILDKSFLKKEPYQICAELEKQIEQLNSNNEKQIALSILADYEERNEFFAKAADHYIEAAKISPQRNKKELLVKAVGSALLANKINLAHSICSKSLLPTLNNPIKKADAKILLFFEWIKVKLLGDDAQDYPLTEITNNLKKYVTNSLFEEFHPAILLTLWWIEKDKKAENTLLKKFPNSIETAVVKGNAILSPKAFWYLMPVTQPAETRSQDLENENTETKTIDFKFGEIPQEIKTERQEDLPKNYQVGFFKNKDYATGLGNELAKKGFTVFIRTKKTKDKSFYSVLVKPDNKGDMILRLKNEGYEAVPIFE